MSLRKQLLNEAFKRFQPLPELSLARLSSPETMALIEQADSSADAEARKLGVLQSSGIYRRCPNPPPLPRSPLCLFVTETQRPSSKS